MQIAVIGDINVDMSWQVQTLPGPGDDCGAQTFSLGSGGCGLNVAMCLAACGAQPQLMASTGDDFMAHEALQLAKKRGIDVSCIQHVPVPTGCCGIAVTPDGQRSFLSFRGANREFSLKKQSQKAVKSAKALFISAHALLEGAQADTTMQLAKCAAKEGIPIFLDLCLPTIQRASQRVIKLLPYVSILCGNVDEYYSAEQNSIDIGALLGSSLHAEVLQVIKKGAKGCRIISSAEPQAMHDFPARQVNVVDTTSCGDAFFAAFGYALLKKHPLETAANFANAVAGAVAGHPGAAEAIPTSIPEPRQYLRTLTTMDDEITMGGIL